MGRPLLRRCRRSDASRSCPKSERKARFPSPTSGLPHPMGYCAQSDCWKKRARRRSADPTGSCTDGDDTYLADGLYQAQGGIEWRDWANLEPGIVQDVAGRLLAVDVAEYLRLRAACKPWRACTDDPRAHGGLDSRFRPRDWIATLHCAPPSRCTLVNVATGARVDADLPELCTHHHLGSAEGILVLCDKATAAIRLLNPLTGALTEYPAISDVQALCAPFVARVTWPLQLGSRKVQVPNPPPIKGAGIEDSTSPPTLVLCLRKPLSRVVCAKPGDPHWVSVHRGEQFVSRVSCLGQIVFTSLLSFKGRCYLTTPRGDVMALDMGPMTSRLPLKPRVVYLLRETGLGKYALAFSYLVRSLDGRMLMVRYSFLRCSENKLLLTDERCNPADTFMSRGAPCRMEVSEVDVAGRRLIPLSGIGDHAVFVGDTHCVMLSADKFPKVAANAVYLNYLLQRLRGFGAYRFEDGVTTPPRDLRREGKGWDPGFVACACHLEFEDYLICDVQQPEIFHHVSDG